MGPNDPANRRRADGASAPPARRPVEREVRPLRDTKGTRVVYRRGAIFSAASFDEITGKTSNSTMSLHFAIH